MKDNFGISKNIVVQEEKYKGAGKNTLLFVLHGTFSFQCFLFSAPFTKLISILKN